MAQQDKLDGILQDPYACPVYYFASTEQELLRRCAATVRTALARACGDAEVTRIDGPAPDLGEVVAAAGAISFFGTPRVVELKEITPSAIKDKDAEELGGLFGALENAVLIVTCLYKDKKTATSKKSKALFGAAQAAGYAAELAKPTRRETLAFLEQTANQQGASFGSGAAEQLLDRAGDDQALLATETAKLAALSGYATITTELVNRHAVHNIEADVFQLAGLITSGRRAAAHEKLGELFQLRHEPVALVGALGGSFVDMYRTRVGTAARRTPAAIAKDFGYSNEWRIKKARENAEGYSTPRLARAVDCLVRLDRQLKGSALSDKTVLVQMAVDELISLRGR